MIIDFWKKNKPIFSVEDFWEDIRAFELGMEEIILNIPYNRRSGVILDRELSIVPIRTEAVPLKYDVIEDPHVRKIVEEASWTQEDFCEMWKWDAESSDYMEIRSCDSSVHPHCECALLVHFIKGMTEGYVHLVPYNYIGLSGLLCVGCQLFFNAYNRVAQHSELPEFFTRGSRASDARPWAMPKDIPSKFQDDIEARLTGLAKNVLTQILDEESSIKDRSLGRFWWPRRCAMIVSSSGMLGVLTNTAKSITETALGGLYSRLQIQYI